MLPCYLGIYPGKTSIKDAKLILENLGGRFMGVFQRTKTDGAYLYTYQFHIGNPLSDEKIVFADVTLVTDNSLVQIIETLPNTGAPELREESIKIYQQYWQRYFTTSQILLQLGEPNQVFVTKGLNELVISYSNPIVIVEISGRADENNLCPKNRQVNTLSVKLIASNSHSPFQIDGDGRVPLSDSTVYIPIENSLGIDVHDFYSKVISDPLICFTIKEAG